MNAERRVVRLETTASTMREAAELAAADYPHGTAVVAERQTAGVGRHGHSWHSETGAGLYVSVILRLAEPTPILTLALGLAAVDAIRETTGIVCDLRWPNDVMVGEKKAAGILVQMAGVAAIAGIGINVNHTGFPPELREVATSLRMRSGREHDREALLARLLRAIDDCCEILRGDGGGAILKMFTAASSYVLGKRVQVDLGERVLEGVTAGLDGAGFLRVRRADGKVETVLAGGVRPV